jgi:integrase/recombinase XerD
LKLHGLTEFISQYPSSETRRAYKRDITHFFLTKRKRPERVTRIDVIGYLNHLKEQGHSSATINRMFSSVRSYMRFLLFEDIIIKNPFEGIRLPKIQHTEKDSITDEEIIKIFSKLRGKDDRTKRDIVIITLMMYNGLRRSEVCGINFGDIKKVSIGGDEYRVLEIRGKGDKTRVRPLHPECWNAIIDYLNCCKRTKGKKEEPVLMGNNGSRISVSTIYNTIKRLEKKAKIKRKLNPHMFRAKFASLALQSGNPITSVQADMGHASIETTAIYDHAKRNIERSSVLKIPKIKRKKKK